MAFELANRAYFAASVSGHGDEFYDQFAERHRAWLAEQEAGISAYYVLVAEDGSVLGRFSYAHLLDAAHQQLGGPLVVVWGNLNTHVSAAMTELVASRDG
jgi:hypothetical protein